MDIAEKKFFEDSGFKILDWQKPDPNVGISEGYIIYKDENGNVLEIEYDTAEFFIYKKDKNKIILNSTKSDYKEDVEEEKDSDKPFSVGDVVITTYNYRSIKEGSVGKIEDLRDDNALIEFDIDGETQIKKIPYVYLKKYTIDDIVKSDTGGILNDGATPEEREIADAFGGAFKKAIQKTESIIDVKPKKRKNAFNWVYDRITNVIAPDLLSQLEEAEYVSDVNGKSQHDADKSGFMYLSIEGIEKDIKGRYVISLAHYYEQNGDLMSDPYMTVRLDTESETAESLSFQMDGIVGNRTQYVYGLTTEGKEGVNLYQKKNQNQFLNKWTKNLVNQNHIVTFNELPEKEEIQSSDIDDKFDLAKGKMYAKVFDDNYETIEWSVQQLSDSTAIARQDLKVKLMGADGSKATINLSRGLNIEDYNPPLFKLAKEVVGIIKKFASIKDYKSIVLSKTSLGNDIYNYSIDELNNYDNYTAKDLYDIRSYFVVSFDRLKQAKGVVSSTDGDKYLSKLDEMINSKMESEGSVNPEIPPVENLEEQKEKYPIVLEWSEGFRDEHIGFNNVEELEAKLKTIEVPETGYVKNKIWFNGIEHHIRIDIGKSNEDYNHEKQLLIDWLSSYDKNYNFYKFQKDYSENNEPKGDKALTKKGFENIKIELKDKPEEAKEEIKVFPIGTQFTEEKSIIYSVVETVLDRYFDGDLNDWIYNLNSGGTITHNEIVEAQKEGKITIELPIEKEQISKEAQDVVRGEWDKMKDFLGLEPDNKKETKTNKYFKGLDADYTNQFELNKAIEEFLDSKDSEYVFNDLEKQFIYGYAGYGGLEKQGATGKGLLWEYYTPKLLVEKMWGLAYKYGFNSGKVLEPSVGVGNFINYASTEYDQVTAYEISKYSARICKIVHPKTNVIEKSFAEHFYNGNVYNPNYEKDFDLVIGNPPYGKNVDKRAVAEAKRIGVSIAQFEHYFILRGLDCLKSGGLLVYVSTANLFTKGYEKIKTKIGERAELVDGYLLPNKTFKTTEIGTSIIVLRKK